MRSPTHTLILSALALLLPSTLAAANPALASPAPTSIWQLAHPAPVSKPAVSAPKDKQWVAISVYANSDDCGVHTLPITDGLIYEDNDGCYNYSPRQAPDVFNGLKFDMFTCAINFYLVPDCDPAAFSRGWVDL
ncbi:hypothetical protein MMC21_003764 [Puttea exsequens]|nr:hypothetical protein [Puttea exsequens]